MTNQTIVNKFFDCYSKRDFETIKQVIADDVVWYFLGQHKYAGIKRGLTEVINFFDTMGGVMSKSKPSVERLIVADKDHYLIECQHIKTNRADNINIDHFVTVLWTIDNGKIVSGRHFFADPQAVDYFFDAIPAD